MRRHPVLAALAGLVTIAHAATVTYDFDISWVRANPDGMADRPTIGINGEWPIPKIQADVGDRIIVNVLNSLGNQTTSLHFHGLFQNGTTHMDGPSQSTQCPIPPGGRFTYNFTVEQPGTYWYHSHTHGQYPDGLRGPLIINDPESPFKDMYQEEIVLTVSDWYHDEMPGLISFFMSRVNPTGAEPVPQSALLNETQNLTIALEPGKTYLFRTINIGAFAGQYLWFEGHNMTILEVDGVYTQPAEASMIYLAAAQRCSFLITAKGDTSENFPIMASMDTDLFDKLPSDLNWNVTGWLVYDSSKPLPPPAVIYDPFEPFDDMTLVPWDNHTIYTSPDVSISLDVIMDNLGDGANYAFFNNITFTSPKVPTLYTALTSGELATNPLVYGEYTHPYVLERGQVVEIVLNNIDPGKHPFHLHGHHFQTVWRSEEEAGPFADSGVTEDQFVQVPMRRDTVVLKPNGNLVMRFRADNPGVWLFHCHLEWHVQSGLVTTFVEAPLDLQKTVQIPDDHYVACSQAAIPTKGNAAANDADFLDLTGQNAPPDPLPAGFTARGIVALVFSCISGIIGVAVIAWYGFADVQEPAAGVPAGQSNKGEEPAMVSSGDESAPATTSPRGNGATDEILPSGGGGR
ncbi:hypothetical protein OQA88_6257 [Cercophora sp. LCS_1]